MDKSARKGWHGTRYRNRLEQEQTGAGTGWRRNRLDQDRFRAGTDCSKNRLKQEHVRAGKCS
jgi:hypothetical protein